MFFFLCLGDSRCRSGKRSVYLSYGVLGFLLPPHVSTGWFYAILSSRPCATQMTQEDIAVSSFAFPMKFPHPSPHDISLRSLTVCSSTYCHLRRRAAKDLCQVNPLIDEQHLRRQQPPGPYRPSLGKRLVQQPQLWHLNATNQHS